MKSYLTQSNLPRGIRNNNPGNIRKSSSAWKGKKTFSSDDEFEQFTYFEYGLRALIKLILNYINGNTSEGKQRNTIRLIAERWAPAGDGANNPAAYAYFVSNDSGIPDSRMIRADDRDTIFLVVRGIVKMENGTKYILSKQEFLDAWALLDEKATVTDQKKKGRRL